MTQCTKEFPMRFFFHCSAGQLKSRANTWKRNPGGCFVFIVLNEHESDIGGFRHCHLIEPCMPISSDDLGENNPIFSGSDVGSVCNKTFQVCLLARKLLLELLFRDGTSHHVKATFGSLLLKAVVSDTWKLRTMLRSIALSVLFTREKNRVEGFKPMADTRCGLRFSSVFFRCPVCYSFSLVFRGTPVTNPVLMYEACS